MERVPMVGRPAGWLAGFVPGWMGMGIVDMGTRMGERLGEGGGGHGDALVISLGRFSTQGPLTEGFQGGGGDQDATHQ
jgi:hypothetical protein